MKSIAKKIREEIEGKTVFVSFKLIDAGDGNIGMAAEIDRAAIGEFMKGGSQEAHLMIALMTPLMAMINRGEHGDEMRQVLCAAIMEKYPPSAVFGEDSGSEHGLFH